MAIKFGLVKRREQPRREKLSTHVQEILKNPNIKITIRKRRIKKAGQ